MHVKNTLPFDANTPAARPSAGALKPPAKTLDLFALPLPVVSVSSRTWSACFVKWRRPSGNFAACLSYIFRRSATVLSCKSSSRKKPRVRFSSVPWLNRYSSGDEHAVAVVEADGHGRRQHRLRGEQIDAHPGRQLERGHLLGGRGGPLGQVGFRQGRRRERDGNPNGQHH